MLQQHLLLLLRRQEYTADPGGAAAAVSALLLSHQLPLLLQLSLNRHKLVAKMLFLLSTAFSAQDTLSLLLLRLPLFYCRCA